MYFDNNMSVFELCSTFNPKQVHPWAWFTAVGEDEYCRARAAERQHKDCISQGANSGPTFYASCGASVEGINFVLPSTLLDIPDI